MRSVLTALTLIVTLAALLGGCTRCDPWWGDKPAACNSGMPVR